MSIRKVSKAVFVLAISALIATGCSLGGGVPSGSVCVVRGDGIEKKAFNRIVNQAKKSYKTQKQKFPAKGSPEYKQLSKQAVGYLVEQKLYEKEAEELDIEVTDKQIDKRLKDLVKSFFKGDKKKYAKELKKQGLTEDDVRENLKQQMLSEKLFTKVTKKVKASDKEAKKRFTENPTQYETPESRDVAHILVKTKKQADEIYAQVKDGDKAKFASLAKKHSQDPSSKEKGGELTITKGQTVAEFDKEAFSQKTGEVSKPIKTQFGYHIITSRSAVKPATKQKFADVKDTIKQTIEQEEKGKVMQEWRKDLLKDAEKDVECLKGYVWTQTATSDTGTDTPPDATPPTETGDDSKKSDSKKSDSKKDDK